MNRIENRITAWVAVDKDGTEKIFNSIPIRRNALMSIAFGIVTQRIIRNTYSKNKRHKWAAHWSTEDDNPLPEGAIVLPKGTIRKLIGRNLTWKDEPVELTKDKNE